MKNITLKLEVSDREYKRLLQLANQSDHNTVEEFLEDSLHTTHNLTDAISIDCLACYTNGDCIDHP